MGDPGNYYCRKGFYALNVQAIVDKKKQFLWSYPSNKGSTHDSAAFCGSKLYDLLKETAKELYNRGLFIVGDSAYGLAPFLLVPYDQAELKEDVLQAKDSFNYHLSSCRIHVECAFGELVMRWGVLWRTLLFDLKKCSKIVNGCMLLHNYIIGNRNRKGTEADNSFFRDFEVNMDATQETITVDTGEMPLALVTDNNEPNPGGRPSLEESQLRDLGGKARDRLTVKLSTYERLRPLQHDMHYNKYGHIYMSS